MRISPCDHDAMVSSGGTVSGPARAAPGLRRDAIGLREVLFQSITDMAPGAAIAASIPAGAAYAGGALPLSVLVALVACLLSASCIGLLARELPSAGSLATYAARGLHPAVDFLTAWGYVLVGVLIAPLVLLQLGFTTASTINSDFPGYPGYPANLWWPWSLAGAVIILVAGFYGIRTSARLGTILGITEIAVFLVLAVFFVVHAGHGGARRACQHGRGVHQQVHAEGIPRHLRGDRGLGVLGAGVRRIRGRGTAGRRGAGPAAHHPAGGAAGHAGHRPALRVHHLRGGCGLRPGRVRRVRQFRPGVVGGHGPLAVQAVLVLRVPRHRQLDDRERQRGGERGQQDRLRHGPDQGLPSSAGPGAPQAPLAGRSHLHHVRPDSGDHARPGPGLQPDQRVRHGRYRDRDRPGRGVHRGQRRLHRVFRLAVTARAGPGGGTRCCTWSSRWPGSPRSSRPG